MSVGADQHGRLAFGAVGVHDRVEPRELVDLRTCVWCSAPIRTLSSLLLAKASAQFNARLRNAFRLR